VAITRGWRASAKGRSHCDGCGRRLNWWELLPVISICFLAVKNKGRTKCCQSPISLNYLATEVFAFFIGVLIGWLWLISATGVNTLLLVPISLVWLYLSLEDIWKLTVSRSGLMLLVGFVCIAELISSVNGAPLFAFGTELISRLVLTVVVAILTAGLILINKGKGLAMHDLVLLSLVTFTLGFPQGLFAVNLTIVLSSCVAVVFIIRQKRLKDLIIPFVPFIFLAWLLLLAFQ